MYIDPYSAGNRLQLLESDICIRQSKSRTVRLKIFPNH